MVTLCSLVCVKDFEEEASKILPRDILGFYKSGATSEQTLQENQDAIQRWYIRPRFLIDVSKCDLSTTILGHKVKVPFGVAPTGMQKMAHPDGECACARAASQIGAVYTLSTVATSSIEEIAAENGLRFFQLYIYKDRDIAVQLIRRAENSGYKGLVLTVDVPICGIRYADVRNRFTLPPHLRIATFDAGDKNVIADKFSPDASGISEYVSSYYDSTLTWKDITWLKSITTLPIVLKGILTAEDAIMGVNMGAAAIWVSNHGGRQVDGVLPTIEALPEIVAAVGHKCEVYVDGGFRTGSDIFKALAIGARMVFLGRPLIWGIACGGSEGAYKVLTLLRNELESAMILTGFPSVERITSKAVVKGTFSKL